MRGIVPPVVLAFCLVWASPAQADELYFKNGDRWTGELQSLVEGRLRFRSDLAGTLEVDASQLLTFRTEEPVELHLADGKVIVSPIELGEAHTVRTLGPGATAAHVVALDDTVSINPPAREIPGWEGTLVAGMQLERGNTTKNSAYVNADVSYENLTNRVELSGAYDGERTTDRSTRVGTTNDRNLIGRIIYDYFLTEKWFLFGTGSGEKDGPSDLDLRLIAGGGVGYKFADRPELKLRFRVGPAWVREDFSDNTGSDDKVAALLNWDLTRQLVANLSYFHRGFFNQSFKNEDDQLLKVDMGFRSDLTQRLFLEARIIWEWTSQPARSAERQDVDYVLGLGYRF